MHKPKYQVDDMVEFVDEYDIPHIGYITERPDKRGRYIISQTKGCKTVGWGLPEEYITRKIEQ